MKYIIDGYNLIFAEPSLAGLMKDHPEIARKRLLDRIYIFQVNRKHNITVVFDGKIGISANEKHPPGIKVIFTKQITADRQIRNFIEAVRNPKQVMVVSSDYKDIGVYAKNCGVGCLTSEQFLELLDEFEITHRGKPEKPDTVSKAEVNYWLKRFRKRT